MKFSPTPRGKPVSVFLSDLFFNLDHADSSIIKNGKFSGFDRGKLADEAKWFLNALDGLGVEDLPEVYDVIEDFLRRV